jgi:DNA-binding transcriptional regulator WhiA
MKRLYLLFLCCFVTSTQSQTSFDSSKFLRDQNDLILECLQFKPLELKIPKEVFKELSKYYILNHGIDFDRSTNLKANSKQVLLITKTDLVTVKSHFLFHTLSVDNDKAFVRYYFVYTDKGIENTIPITIDFKKNNGIWQVFNYSI